MKIPVRVHAAAGLPLSLGAPVLASLWFGPTLKGVFGVFLTTMNAGSFGPCGLVLIPAVALKFKGGPGPVLGSEVAD